MHKTTLKQYAQKIKKRNHEKIWGQYLQISTNIISTIYFKLILENVQIWLKRLYSKLSI